MNIGAIVTMVVAVLGIAPVLSQVPAFSSRVEAVRVDVLVTDGGRIVRDLQAGDFEVLDNRVAQQVDLVTFERLALSVVLVFDMSDSVAGDRLAHLQSAGLALVNQLTDEDEAALLTFSHVVTVAAPLSRERLRLRSALKQAEGYGRSALIDAAHAGIVLGESGPGRPLMIVFSDGMDTSSWLTAERVLDTARRSDVVIYCVSTPVRGRAEFARQLTSVTGGSFLEISSTKDLGPTFLRILEEFRQRYLVSYTPRGVSTEGWHQLDVRVKRRSATVRARPGYIAGR